MKTNRRAFLGALAALGLVKVPRPLPDTLRGCTYPEWKAARELWGNNEMLDYQAALLRSLEGGRRVTLMLPPRHGKTYYPAHKGQFDLYRKDVEER